MNSLQHLQLLLFFLFIGLIIVGGRLKKSLTQDVVYSSAFAALLTFVASLFTTQVELLLFSSLWIYSVGVASHLRLKHHQAYNAFMAVGFIWLLILMVFTILQAPLLFVPTILISILLGSVNRYMFAQQKAQTMGFLETIESTLRFKKRSTFAAALPSVIPLLLLLSIYLTRWSLIIKDQMLHTFYPMISYLVGTFLAIVVTVSIFLISIRRETRGLSDFLVKSAKGLCVLYSITLTTSLIGLFSIPVKEFQVSAFQVESSIIFYQSVLMIDLGLFFACVLYLVVTLFEVVELPVG